MYVLNVSGEEQWKTRDAKIMSNFGIETPSSISGKKPTNGIDQKFHRPLNPELVLAYDYNKENESVKSLATMRDQIAASRSLVQTMHSANQSQR
jgi:hypothetical protein